jgi:protein subunit release factor A
MEKELIFSQSKNNGDFIVQPFKGSGKGGQKRNKTMSACRIIHPASGTVSECQEERSFVQNKKKAFQRLVEKDSFKNWWKVEVSRKMGVLDRIEAYVEKEMASDNIRVEAKNDGRWKMYDE